MRKFITLCLIMSIVGFSFAQKVQDLSSRNLDKNLVKANHTQNAGEKWNGSSSSRAAGDTIAYYDFDGALPSGWTNVDNTSNNYVWIWSTIGPIGAYTGNPNWDDPDVALASTTGANGYMMFQADNYNTDQTTGTITNPYTDHDSYIMTNAIDLSGYASVIVKFQERFRVCCSWSGTGLWMGVSTNGTTWTDYLVNDGVAINDQSAADNAVNDIAVNISAVAANQPTVYLRWYIQGLSHYYWMVDDVALVEGVDYDIIMNRDYTDFFSFDDGFYKQIPWIQAKYWPIGFRAAIFNNGAASATNVLLTADVEKGGTSVFNENSLIEYPIASMASLTNDTIYLLGDDFYTTPPGQASFLIGTPESKKGVYTLTHTVSMDSLDENPADNVAVNTFEITGTVYARDDGSADGNIAPQDWVGHGLDGEVLGVRYVINDDSSLTEVNSIKFYVANRTDSVVFPTVRATLYLSDGAGGYDAIISSDLYDITDADRGTWVTLPLVKDGFSEFLVPGNYLAGVEFTAYNGGDGLWIGEDKSTPQVEWASIWMFMDDPGAWFYLSNYGLNQTPMIRLGFETPASVENSAMKETVKVYPNPTTGMINVCGAENATISIYNVTGQLVTSVENAARIQTIDMSDFAEGNYVVKVVSDTKTTTSKITFVR